MDARVRNEEGQNSPSSVGFSDASEQSSGDETLQSLSRFALIGLFLLVLLAALSIARPVVVPVLAAFVVGMTIGRPVDRLKRSGFPPWLMAIAIVCLALLIVLAGAVLLAAPVSDWVSRAPDVTALIKERLNILARPMNALQEISATLSNMGGDKAQIAVATSHDNIVQGVLGFLTPALGELILFFGALLFFLLGRAGMKGKLVLSFVDRANRLLTLRIIADVENDLTTYLATTTMINLGVGLCTAAIAWALGMPNAPVWGSLAFLLNYLPYIGPTLMIAILFVAGLISFPALGQSLAPAALFLGLTTIEGQFLSPTLLGKRLELNPLAVFLGMAFWTWLWGPVGAFLSVPLLVIGMVIWRNIFPVDTLSLP